jgi:eukaryotic-like serine/threonine-protein kinase
MGTLRPVAEPLDPATRIGRVLRERWRVDELVWTTPASSLYWATHRTGTRAAIRVLAPELSANDARAGAFLETASIVQGIGHDGAVRILDDDRDQDGCVFLVLELFDATSLRALLDGAREPMAIEDAARVGVGTLEVLAAAHRAGIAHGALRAEDVFITRQGHVKLLGFEGRPGDLAAGPNFQADTSAVGTLLYTMLAAVPPRGHSLAMVRPDLPEWLVEVVDRALGFGAAVPWPAAGAMLAAILSMHRPSTRLDVFEPTQTPGGSFVPFPVTGDMNPLFVQTGGPQRPVASSWPDAPHRFAPPAVSYEAHLHRQRRRQLAIGLVLFGAGLLSVIVALWMRQM